MARRRARGRERVIGTTRWQATAVSGGVLSAGSVAVGAVLGAGAPSETILRTRGTGLLTAASSLAPGTSALISMGLVLVPEGQGTTVIWDPFNDDNAPWMWWQEITLAYEEPVANVIDLPVASAARFEIDSKAMRKANEDEELQFVATNTTFAGAMAIRITANFRFLLGH